MVKIDQEIKKLEEGTKLEPAIPNESQAVIRKYANYVKARRTTLDRVPIMDNGKKIWKDILNMGADNGTHFPKVGDAFSVTGKVRSGLVGQAESKLLDTRQLVDFSAPYFAKVLT